MIIILVDTEDKEKANKSSPPTQRAYFQCLLQSDQGGESERKDLVDTEADLNQKAAKVVK